MGARGPRCGVCMHPQLAEINAAILKGRRPRDLAATFGGPSEITYRRHATRCGVKARRKVGAELAGLLPPSEAKSGGVPKTHDTLADERLAKLAAKVGGDGEAEPGRIESVLAETIEEQVAKAARRVAAVEGLIRQNQNPVLAAALYKTLRDEREYLRKLQAERTRETGPVDPRTFAVWDELRAGIIEALDAFPEARVAVAKAFAVALGREYVE